jgi:outer membrane receptor protein involved in Fe transport
MRRILRRARAWTATAAALLLATTAFAGTTGKLAGRVTDEKKQPVPGVNVRIEGQRLGAVTDENGDYFVLAIPAGRYTVRMNVIGFAPYVAEGVEIVPDFSTRLDAVMRTEAVQMGEVVVSAERSLLQKDATGTTRFISGKDIQKLPTRGYRDAAAQQTGVVNFARNIDNEAQNGNTLIIRGGRPNETAYFVDGFSQQDPLTGTSSTAISNNAISEVVVLTGGFNAEYGRIMSGAVNVVTREGADKYFGSFEAVSDMLAGSWVGADRTDYNVYDVSFGGPVVPGRDDLSFYVSGERRWQGDRSPSTLTDGFRSSLEARGLHDARKPNNSLGGFTFQGKLAWQPSDAITFKVGGLGSEDDWRQYSHAYLFNADHMPRYVDRNVNYYATYNQVVNPRTFLNLGVNYFETLRKRGDGVHFDRIGEYYQPSGNPLFDQEIPLFWETGHVFDDYMQRQSSYVGFQGSMSSQIDRHHQLKVGADLQLHSLRYFNHFFPTNLGGANPNLQDWDGYGYTIGTGPDGRFRLEEVDDGRDGMRKPKSWSAYAQDKFEYEGVVVNGGLRFDHFDVATQSLRSERFPLGDPSDPSNLPDSLESGDLSAARTYGRLSPRFGVAFPLDDRSILRFNYGQFYQQPNLQDLYVSYRFLQHKVRTGGYFVGFGNPNLRPERTTAYEVGFQRQVGERARVDVTAYYKDVKDLVEITNVPSSPKSFSSYRNRDFATIKGLDVGLAMRPSGSLSGSVNYSLSFAQGTGSVSNSQRNAAWVGATTPKQTSPLDFDQRHKISMNLDWRTAKGQGPSLGAFHMLERTGVNALLNIGSGTPYTPTRVYNEVSLAANSPDGNGQPYNSRYGPWTMSLDLKATRGFSLGGFEVEAFVWALNVTDNENATAVYTSSGTATSTTWLQTADGRDYLARTGDEGSQLYDLATNNPNLYSNPRLVRFGFRTDF